MDLQVILGLIIPLLGTSLGAAMVFFIKDEMGGRLKKSLSGFAAGVMVAASIWSLIIPAMDQVEPKLGKFSFIPVIVGFSLGVLFLLFMDTVTPHMHPLSKEKEGPSSKMSGTSMMVFAVALHNIPEGMAVGVVFAGFLNGGGISMAGALALSIGIALQNFPEGAIVSLPLKSEGMSKKKAFWIGAFTGILEPIASILTILLASLVTPFLPYFLAFAAGAMMYVVVEELVPGMSEGNHSNIGTMAFTAGFLLMLVLDVSLG